MKNKILLRTIIALTLCCAASNGAAAQNDVQHQGNTLQVNCENPSLIKNGSRITAGMDLNLSDLKVRRNKAVILTPMIVKGADTLAMPSIGIYGRTRWYQFYRAGVRPLTGKTETALRAKKRPAEMRYAQATAYQDWMNGSELILKRTDYGCCGHITRFDDLGPLALYKSLNYEPTFRFQAVTPEEVKTRELAGRAYIDFPVNLTTIYPDYRRNYTELAKIIATIDSVRNDKDITVKSLSIKGFASPEGPYDNNIRLAKGRTEALKQYVQGLYLFDYGFIQTSYEPEDWEGLREYVVNSTIDQRDGILAIIDSNMEPDAKNTKLQTTYPEQYRFLLENVYPALRHSDYRIEYTIRGFTDLAEIAAVMRTQPSKLSLNEMYMLAGTMIQGTDEYNEVMETAARMYPMDETANLNAASAAMQRGDLVAAERYLLRAGSSAEALYGRGVLAGLQGDFEKAIKYMEMSASQGNDAAFEEIEKLKEAQQYAL